MLVEAVDVEVEKWKSTRARGRCLLEMVMILPLGFVVVCVVEGDAVGNVFPAPSALLKLSVPPMAEGSERNWIVGDVVDSVATVAAPIDDEDGRDVGGGGSSTRAPGDDWEVRMAVGVGWGVAVYVD